MRIIELIKRQRLTSTHYVWFARVPFLVASIGGASVLVALKYVGVSQLWVTIAAISFLVSYAIIVQSISILRLRDDLLGDNCYYLGFLYTLFSLAWALYDFASSGDTELIVSNFGLALGSTIGGVILRVTINQSRKDVLETEQDTRMELADAASRMRSKIDEAVIALDVFCKSTQQMAMEQINASAEEASNALNSSIKEVGKTSTQVMEQIDSAFSDFRTHASQLNEVSKGNVRAMKALLTKIEAIDAPSDLVSRRFSSLLDTTAATTERINEQLRLDEEALRSATDRNQSLAEKFGVTAVQIEAATAALSATVTSIEKAATAAESLSGNFQGSLTQVTETLHLHNNALASELDRTRRMVVDTGSALSELAESIVARVK